MDVNVNVSVVVLSNGSSSSSNRTVFGVNVVVLVVLVLGTGTAVVFLFARYTDLLFAVVVFLAGREFSVGGERSRVLTFPSGLLLGGEFDLKLFVSMG